MKLCWRRVEGRALDAVHVGLGVTYAYIGGRCLPSNAFVSWAAIDEVASEDILYLMYRGRVGICGGDHPAWCSSPLYVGHEWPRRASWWRRSMPLSFLFRQAFYFERFLLYCSAGRNICMWHATRDGDVSEPLTKESALRES